jgi:transposase
MAGRPTNLTPEVHTAFVAALKRSWYIETAASLVGVGRSTVYGWMRRGRKETEGPFAEFLDDVKKALAEQEAHCLDRIRVAGADHWQALAWLLERRYPNRWSSSRAQLKELCKRWDELDEEIDRLRDRMASVPHGTPPDGQGNGTYRP